MKPIHGIGTLWVIVLGSFFFFSCQPPVVKPDIEKEAGRNQTYAKYVLLVSIDGYRHDYTKFYKPRFLSKMITNGTSARGFIPIFPSKTFTNHTTMVTGQFASGHGILANSFYDRVKQQFFFHWKAEIAGDGSWYEKEPIWVTAEKQGMRTATHYWPGSEASISGVRPSYYLHFKPETEHSTAIRQILDWLMLPAGQRPHFITWYFPEVDMAGHNFGPLSKEVGQAISRVDQALEKLNTEVQALGLPIYLVVVSDHGMEKLDYRYSYDREKLPEELRPSEKIRWAADPTLAMMYSTDALQVNKVFRYINSLKHRKFKAYLRNQLPRRFHFDHPNRTGDLVIVSKAPFSLIRSKSIGNHGFDPDKTPSMHGIFYLNGPGVPRGKVINAIHNIHLYSFLLKLLQLEGTLEPEGIPEPKRTQTLWQLIGLDST